MSEEAEVVRRYFEAFNSHDLDGVMESFAENVTFCAFL